MSTADTRGAPRTAFEELLTPRLRGEPLRLAHSGVLRTLHRDPRVMDTLGGIVSDEEADRRVELHEAHWHREGFGLWVLFAREDGAFVGRGGLRRCEVSGRSEVEVAYALAPSWWGRGLATELASASLAVGFDHLGLDSIVSFTLPTNLASRRVMEKNGLHFEGDFVYADLPHVLYRITKAEWAARLRG